MGEPSERDAERFTRLYRGNYRAIHAYAYRRLRDRDSAADMAAEVFTIAWRRLDVVPNEPLPWLYAVAFRVLMAARRALPPLADSVDGLDLASDSDLAGAYEAREELRRVAQALDRLSVTDRQVLLITAWEGLSGEDLATALGCGRTAAAVRLHRARRRLNTLLTAAAPLSPVVPADPRLKGLQP